MILGAAARFHAMRMLIVFGVLASLWLPGRPVQTFAQAATGATLTVLAAGVQIAQAGGSFGAAQDGQALNVGDSVRTDGSGVALLTFFDGSEVQVTPASQVQIQASSEANRQVSVFQAAGTTVNRVQRLAGNGSFQTNTPAAVALVRGTTYVVTVTRLASQSAASLNPSALFPRPMGNQGYLLSGDVMYRDGGGLWEDQQWSDPDSGASWDTYNLVGNPDWTVSEAYYVDSGELWRVRTWSDPASAQSWDTFDDLGALQAGPNLPPGSTSGACGQNETRACLTSVVLLTDPNGHVGVVGLNSNVGLPSVTLPTACLSGAATGQAVGTAPVVGAVCTRLEQSTQNLQDVQAARQTQQQASGVQGDWERVLGSSGGSGGTQGPVPPGGGGTLDLSQSQVTTSSGNPPPPTAAPAGTPAPTSGPVASAPAATSGPTSAPSSDNPGNPPGPTATSAPAAADAGSGVVSPASGGTVASPGGASATFPPGAVAGDTLVTIAQTTPSASPPAGQQFAGPAYDFGVSSPPVAAGPGAFLAAISSHFNQHVTITLPYTSSTPPDSIVYFDTASNTWQSIGIDSVNTTNHTVTGRTLHFTLFSTTRVTGSLPPLTEGPCGTSAPAVSGSPVLTNYTVADNATVGAAVSFNWLEASTNGQRVSSLDSVDDVCARIDLPFNFPIYGQSFDKAFIDSNGLLSFGVGTSSYSNTQIPSGTYPVAAPWVAPLWDDIDSRCRTDDGIFYRAFTQGGLSFVVIEWKDWQHFSCQSSGTAAGENYTFEAILYSDGSVVFQYLTMDNPSLRLGATVGLQNQNGTRGVQYAYNNASLTPAGRVVRFAPSGVSTGSTDPGQSTVVASPTTVPADGTTTSTVTVTLKNVVGGPVPGKTVTLSAGSATGVTVTPSSGVSDASGQVVFTVKSTAPQVVTLAATDVTGDTGITQRATVDFNPLNDNFAQAATLAIPASVTGSTRGATIESGEPIHAGDSSCFVISGHQYQNSVWYRLTPSQTGWLTLSTANTGTDFDSVMALYTGTSLGSLTRAACDNNGDSGDAPTTPTWSSVLHADVTAGQTYYLQLAGVGGAPSGAYALTSALSTAPALSITTSSLPDATSGAAYSQTVSASGGDAPYTWGVTGLPSNLSLSQDGSLTATIGGTPVPAGTYPLAFTLRDSSGRTTSRTLNLVVQPGAVSASQSTVVANPTSVPADNATTSTITVTLKDANNNVVPGKDVSLSVLTDSSATISPSGTVTTGSSGQAAFTVRSASVGTATFGATDVTDSQAISQTATVAFTSVATPTPTPGITPTPTITPTPPPALASASTSLVSATPTSVVANGVDTTTITVTLKDASGNPVSGKSVSLSSSGTSVTISTVSGTTDASGQATFTAKTTLAQSGVVFTAHDVTDGLDVNQTASVTFTPGAATQLQFGYNPGSGGIDYAAGRTFHAVVVVLDAYNNQVTSGFGSNASITISLVGSGAGSTGTLSGTLSGTASSGFVDFTGLSITAPGTYQLRATTSLSGISVGLSNSFGIVAGTPTTVTVTASPTSLLPTQSSTITATVQNEYGALMSGQSVSFIATSPGDGSFSPSSATTNSSGQATTTFTASVSFAGTTITATAGSASGSTAISGPAVTPTSTSTPTPVPTPSPTPSPTPGLA